MARYPGARWRPIPETNDQARIKPTQVILHSAVSNAASLYGYWNSGGVTLESHFYVDRDGNIEQYVDTTVRADANYKANARAISIETWDGGNPDRNPWNPAQVKALVALVAWCCKMHGIPARRAPAWDAPGIGGHTDYPGVWSNVRGKTCPGVARRPQVPQIIAAVAKGGSTTANVEDDDMPTAEEIAKEIWNGKYNGESTMGNLLRAMAASLGDVKNPATGKKVSQQTALQSTWHYAYFGYLAASDPGKIAAAIIAALPKSAGSLTESDVQTAVEKGMRNVLGSLDEQGAAK